MAETEAKQVESKPEVKTGLTPEDIQKVKQDDSIEFLPPEKQKEFHDRFVVGNEEIPEEAPKAEEEPKATEEVQKPEIETVKEEKEKVKPLSEEDEENLRKKYYLKSNELNETKLKLQSVNKRLEKVEKPLPKETKEVDVYDEEYLKGLATRQQALEDRQTDREKSEETDLQTEKAKLEFQSDLLEIAQLQVENTSLQTEKPFSALNAAYSRFQTDVGGPENRDKFLSDPEYRKNMESQGIIFPMSTTDWKKYKELLNIRSYKLEHNSEDLDSAYYKYQKVHGIVSDSVKEASLEATQKTTETIANSSQESTILPPNAGTMAEGSIGWTKETIDSWIAANPYPKTEKDKSTMREINQIVQRGLLKE